MAQTARNKLPGKDGPKHQFLKDFPAPRLPDRAALVEKVNSRAINSSDGSSSRAGGASRPPVMDETLTAQEKLLLRAFRKLPEGQRTRMLDSMRSASSTATSDAKPKPLAKKPSQLPDLTLVRRRAALELLARESDLANPALDDDERLRRSQHVLKTYERLRQGGADYDDDTGTVKAARKIVNHHNYKRRTAALA